MQCPQCKVEMDTGGLMHDGNKWFNEGHFVKVKRMSFGGKAVYAFRCPQCGKVELTTDIKAGT